MLFDYLTGSEFSFSIFYLIPISLVAWFIDRETGVIMSILGAACWLTVDLLTHSAYSHPATPYWNMLVRLGFFLIVTVILSGLRVAQVRKEELREFIVHDLRSPLSNVMVGLQTLQEIANETGDTTQEELVKTCLTSCQRMLMLINALLDLARLESEQMPLQMEEIDVEELVESSLRQVWIWAGQKHILVKSQLDTGVKTVCADSELTGRVLVNLLSNAIKFSPVESTIMVNVTPTDNGKIAFSITDQGQGLPQEWRSRVFEKFAQAEARQSRGTFGSGIGLTFCRSAVEAQNGQIWIKSAINQGTVVTFTLAPGIECLSKR